MNAHKALEAVKKTKEPKLLNASFNQDQSCFAICHESGFRVYNTDPMELKMQRNFNSISNSDNSINGSGNSGSGNSGIGLISMLHRTNYVALVGGGKQPRFPINKVCIWDDLKKKPSIFLEFMSPILNVLLSRIRIIVVLKNKVLIHAFESKPKLLSSYETYDNDSGVADLSISENISLLAFPGRTVGQIQLVDISPLNKDRNLISIIKAHKSKIRYISISTSGSMIASASETGTIIRVHDTSTCSLLFEFRRGLDKAVITSMKFSPNDQKLAVLSDKNTLHVYNLQTQLQQHQQATELLQQQQMLQQGEWEITNKSHFLKKLPLLPNYFKSTWSFVSKNVGNKDDYINDFGIIGWSDNESIIILWKFKGIWEKYVIVENNDELALPGSSGSGMSNGTKHNRWEVVREGWRSFGDLN
ncbi:hypothetical protein CANARDRAFT_80719 [[Candida] arabinofermentans NRRL YB-2248]|uniref:SVP1-like protein 2 n=1 Tax=[Candida] arabinofermentans NRRL YB-2248 TaxID=983967 RepID=A0A1E4SV56_9ASCO|nr:hypothetical protein CANARDRAFT_80719 [[Candida] arabinofermentans NRRL YB-2248]